MRTCRCGALDDGRGRRQIRLLPVCLVRLWRLRLRQMLRLLLSGRQARGLGAARAERVAALPALADRQRRSAACLNLTAVRLLFGKNISRRKDNADNPKSTGGSSTNGESETSDLSASIQTARYSHSDKRCRSRNFGYFKKTNHSSIIQSIESTRWRSNGCFDRHLHKFPSRSLPEDNQFSRDLNSEFEIEVHSRIDQLKMHLKTLKYMSYIWFNMLDGILLTLAGLSSSEIAKYDFGSQNLSNLINRHARSKKLPSDPLASPRTADLETTRGLREADKWCAQDRSEDE
jgi:hypothetical protein